MENILKTLKMGMCYNEVTEKFGEPDANLGDTMKVIGYNIDNEKMVVLNFGLQDHKKLNEAYIMHQSSKKFSDMTLEESKIYGSVF